MILAHLLKEGLYDKKYFNKDSQYVILDNGLYEQSQVSNDLETYIQLAETCGINVNEIVIPDAMFNYEETIRLFEQNLETIKKWQHKYKFMFVAQAKSYAELHCDIKFINRMVVTYPALQGRLVLGISKLTPLDRASNEAITLYKQSLLPIHLLGLKDTFEEILPLRSLNCIRSCDTAQIASLSLSGTFADVLKAKREQDIDLKLSICNDLHLSTNLETFRKQWREL